jgi:hypothetical protein
VPYLLRRARTCRSSDQSERYKQKATQTQSTFHTINKLTQHYLGQHASLSHTRNAPGVGTHLPFEHADVRNRSPEDHKVAEPLAHNFSAQAKSQTRIARAIVRDLPTTPRSESHSTVRAHLQRSQSNPLASSGTTRGKLLCPRERGRRSSTRPARWRTALLWGRCVQGPALRPQRKRRYPVDRRQGTSQIRTRI